MPIASQVLNVTPIAALLSVTSIFALLSTSKTAMISAHPFALNILRYHGNTGRGKRKEFVRFSTVLTKEIAFKLDWRHSE